MEPKPHQSTSTVDRATHGDNRGTAGLGTLLLFIVMVVVAAVSAGILINTTGLLESSADNTPSAQPDQPVQVVEKTGQVASTDNSTVQTVRLTVERGPNSDRVTLADVTVEWFGPTGHTPLHYGQATEIDGLSKPATEFALGTVQDSDDSHPQLNAASDRFTIKIDAAAISGGRGLPPGTTVAVKFTTPSGATHFVTIETPNSIGTKTTVSL